MELQAERCEPVAQLGQEPLGIFLVLKPNDGVIGKPHRNRVTAVTVGPSSEPQIEHVVQVQIGQKWTDASTLCCSCLARCPRPIFLHASVQPFLDEPHDAPVRNPMLDELD